MPRKNENGDGFDEDEDNDFSDFDDFFSDPNKFFRSKQFKNLFKEIFEKILKGLPSEFKNLSPEDIKKEYTKNKRKFGPFIAGFKVGIGPDGKPTIDSFGHVKPKPYGKPKVNSVREPLVEINEESDQIIVIAEIPGISREDIEIKATTHSLTISTKSDSFGRKYYKEIELPSAINSDYAKASLRNGILQVKMKKIKDKSSEIKIN